MTVAVDCFHGVLAGLVLAEVDRGVGGSMPSSVHLTATALAEAQILVRLPAPPPAQPWVIASMPTVIARIKASSWPGSISTP